MTSPLIEIRSKKAISIEIFTFAAALLASGCHGDPAAGALAAEASPDPLPEPGTLEIFEPLLLTDRARVPEKEAGFVGALVRPGQLVIAHDGALRPIEPGDVLTGTQAGGYLVRAVQVTAKDTTHYQITTEPAQLTDLLARGSLHIHYDAADHARRLDDYLASHEPLGEEDGDELALQAQALKVGASGALPLLQLSHAALPASCGVKASGTLDVDLTATLTPTLDIELDVGPGEGLDVLPRLKKFRLVASGTLEVDTTLHGEGTVSAGCSIDLLALAGGAPALPLPPLTFWAGPVPIVVTTDVVPVASIDVETTFHAASLTAQATATASLTAGVHYEDEQWTTLWHPACESTGSAHLESPGDIHAECTVSAGAELRTRLYGLLGPNLGVVAYARAQSETAPPYCTHETWLDAGLRAYAEAEVGLSVGPVDLTLAELPLVDFDLLHTEGPHWTGPLSDDPECAGMD